MDQLNIAVIYLMKVTKENVIVSFIVFVFDRIKPFYVMCRYFKSLSAFLDILDILNLLFFDHKPKNKKNFNKWFL